MDIKYETNKIVDEVGKMHFSGNIVPEIWFQTLKGVKKTTISLVTLILAEIVYWYRPTEVRDEAGQFVLLKKKFYDPDFLQISYKQLSNKFGVSERQSKAAIVALEDIGVIRRHFKTITSKTGITCTNVMYIELIPSKLKELTFPEDTPMTINRHTSDNISSEVCASNDIEPSINRQTNTNITSNTSSEDFIQSFLEMEGPISSFGELKEGLSLYAEFYSDNCRNIEFCEKLKSMFNLNNSQYTEIALLLITRLISYDDLIIDMPAEKDLIDSIVDICCDVITGEISYDNHCSKAIGPNITRLQESVLQLNILSFKSLILRFSTKADEVSNKPAYIIRMLINSRRDYCLNDRYYGYAY